MQIFIQITAGADTGPLFNLASNADVPEFSGFESGVNKADLVAGYTTTAPAGTTTVRVTSTGSCTNSEDILLGTTSTTSTTSSTTSTTSSTSTTTSTTTICIDCRCYEIYNEGDDTSTNSTTYTDCNGNPASLTNLIFQGSPTYICATFGTVVDGVGITSTEVADGPTTCNNTCPVCT